MHSSPMSCRIVTGRRGSGKTTLMLSLAGTVTEPMGFLSIHEGDEYFLLSLASGTKRLLMTSRPLFPGRIGRWSYDQSVFDEAAAVLSSLHSGDVFIDEIGALELSGGGFASALEAIAANNAISLTIAVRDSFLEDVIRKFRLAPSVIIEAGAKL